MTLIVYTRHEAFPLKVQNYRIV